MGFFDPQVCEVSKMRISLFLSSTILCCVLLCPALQAQETAKPLFGDEKEELINPARDVSLLISRGKYQEAIELASSELEKNPKNLNLRFLQGVAYTDMDKTQEAKEIFEQLIREFPEVSEPYNNLAVIYAAEGNRGRAKELLERAIANNNRSVTAYSNLGDIYVAEAAEMYAKALKLSPKNSILQKKAETLGSLK